MEFSADVLCLDPARETARICGRLREVLAGGARRRGLVVGLSGGIDSAVTAALAARAVGPARVFALEMPERHSAAETPRLRGLVADRYGLPRLREEITGILEKVGFYERYIRAVRQVIPEYSDGWTSKLVPDSLLNRTGFTLFSLLARQPDGTLLRRDLPLQPSLEIVAAINLKQRIRKMVENHHADRLHFAVAGTPNRLEYDQGFFVKFGDEATGPKIAHLYKSQVCQLAEYLSVPAEVIRHPRATDTLPLNPGEGCRALPQSIFDLCLHGHERGLPAATVAAATGLTAGEVDLVYRDIEMKQGASRFPHLPLWQLDELPEFANRRPDRNSPSAVALNL